LETIFAISGKLSCSCSSSDRETCWGQWYLLECRKKSENSCSCKSQLGMLCRYERIKNVWAWLWVGQW